jgi:hypothetical protein
MHDGFKYDERRKEGRIKKEERHKVKNRLGMKKRRQNV